MIYFSILVAILFFKFFILKKASKSAVDQWYWLKYREAVKSQKQCPPNLPEYLLEVKQWYPPFFGWFIALLPNTIFKYSNFITQIFSLFRLMLLFLLAYLLDIEFSLSLFLGVLIYLTAPILIYYDNQINSRIFGAIILDILVLLFFGYFEFGIDLFLVPILLLTILLLFAHKMSHQLYLFLLMGISVFYMSFIPMVIYIFSNIIAIIFFNYKKYLKAHIEIVKFWHRHRYKLGAHQFYESDIYGKDGFVYGNRLHGDGIKSIIKKIALIVGMLPFTLFIIFNFELNFFTIVISITLLFIILTSFIDIFLCLGAGSLYNYNLVTFLGFYLVYIDVDYTLLSNQVLLFIVFAMTLLSIYKFYKGLGSVQENKELNNAIEFLKKTDLDRIMVLPFQLPDEIAYKTNKKVFWGGHGYGFLWLEAYFPVFNVKIEDTIDEWNLGAVFLQKSYFKEFFDVIDKSIVDVVFENSKYVIVAVKNWENRDVVPSWAIDKYLDIFNKVKNV